MSIKTWCQESHYVLKCSNCVVEKTVRRAERAWYISLEEMWGKPGAERSFLAGETESVFEITNWNTRNVIHHGFGDVCVKTSPKFLIRGWKEGGRGIVLPLPFLNLDALPWMRWIIAQRPFEWSHVLIGTVPGQSPLKVILGVILFILKHLEMILRVE